MTTITFNFSQHVPVDRQREVQAAIKTLHGMFPEKTEMVVQDANGKMWRASRGGTWDNGWSITKVSTLFHDGFLLDDEERHLMANNQKIAAIKGLRTRYGFGLFEAKQHVDFFARTYFPHGLTIDSAGRCEHPVRHREWMENTSTCRCCGHYFPT